MSKTWDIEVRNDAGDLLKTDVAYTEGRVRNPIMASYAWINRNRQQFQEAGLKVHNVRASARPTEKPVSKSPDMTCGACLRTQKATKGRMALHGYKRPGGGWQTASCVGARLQPWEVSPEGGEAVRRAILAYLPHAKAVVVSLENPERTEVKIEVTDYDAPRNYLGHRPMKTITIVKGGPAYNYLTFEKELENQIKAAKRNLQTCEMELMEIEKRLATWKPKAQVSA